MQFWNQIHRHKKDFLIPGDADKNKISKIFMTLLLYLPFGKGRGGGRRKDEKGEARNGGGGLGKDAGGKSRGEGRREGSAREERVHPRLMEASWGYEARRRENRRD